MYLQEGKIEMQKNLSNLNVCMFTLLFSLGSAASSLAGVGGNAAGRVAPDRRYSSRLEDNSNAGGVAVTGSQTISFAGKYIFKTYRKGKGGFENYVEVAYKSKGKIHVTFNGTYFYMADGEETFHEGSGEGDGLLKGNIATVSLDGDDGTCRLTLTFNASQVAVKSSPNCALNVVPDGIYKKEISAAVKTKGFDVCPDPSAPCESASRGFAEYELPFRLPARLKPHIDYRSVPFYAVLIKTYKNEECDEDGYTASIERERLRIQKSYPTRKVFGSHNCPDMDGVGYDFPGQEDASGKLSFDAFIAVYAGQSPDEAREFLTNVRTLFPEAELKQMIASYEIIDQ